MGIAKKAANKIGKVRNGKTEIEETEERRKVAQENKSAKEETSLKLQLTLWMILISCQDCFT